MAALPAARPCQGLQQHEEVKLFCGMIDTLALLPTKHVQAGVQLLWASLPVELADLLLYFDRTYVSGEVGSHPLFPPEVWNVHVATVQGSHRTNNACESWNNKLNSLIGSFNPSIWTVLEAIQKDEATERPTLLGKTQEPPRKKKMLGKSSNEAKKYLRRFRVRAKKHGQLPESRRPHSKILVYSIIVYVQCVPQ